MRAKLTLLIGALCLLLTACTAPTVSSENGFEDRFGNDSKPWQGPSPEDVEDSPDSTNDGSLPTTEDNIIILPPGESAPPEPVAPEVKKPDTTFQNTSAEKELIVYLDGLREDFNVSSLRRDDELDKIALEHAKWSVRNEVLLAPESVLDSYRRAERVTKHGEALVATGGPNVALTTYSALLNDPATRRLLNDADVDYFGLGSWCIDGDSCVFSVIVLTTDRNSSSPGGGDDPADDGGSLNNWDGVIDKQYKSCEEVLAHNLGPYVEGVDPEYFWYFDINGDGITCDSLDLTGSSTPDAPDDESSVDAASSTSEPTGSQG